MHPKFNLTGYSKSRLPDHDSTLYVIETPALTTRPLVTSLWSDNRMQSDVLLLPTTLIPLRGNMCKLGLL